MMSLISKILFFYLILCQRGAKIKRHPKGCLNLVINQGVMKGGSNHVI